MSRNTIGGFALAIALVAGVAFAGVAAHELSYASDHPHAYGPAKVIAWAGGAGAALSIAVGLIGLAFTRPAGR